VVPIINWLKGEREIRRVSNQVSERTTKKKGREGEEKRYLNHSTIKDLLARKKRMVRQEGRKANE